jgi:hypothetical protein
MNKKNLNFLPCRTARYLYQATYKQTYRTVITLCGNTQTSANNRQLRIYASTIPGRKIPKRANKSEHFTFAELDYLDLRRGPRTSNKFIVRYSEISNTKTSFLVDPRRVSVILHNQTWRPGSGFDLNKLTDQHVQLASSNSFVSIIDMGSPSVDRKNLTVSKCLGRALSHEIEIADEEADFPGPIWPREQRSQSFRLRAFFRLCMCVGLNSSDSSSRLCHMKTNLWLNRQCAIRKSRTAMLSLPSSTCIPSRRGRLYLQLYLHIRCVLKLGSLWLRVSLQ